MNAPRVDLAQLLVKATTFAKHWRDQDGVNSALLDELADAIDGYVASRSGGVHPDAVIIDDPIKPRCTHPRDEVCPDCVIQFSKAGLVELPDFRLPRVHVALRVQQVMHQRGLHGVLLMRNDSTVALEIVKRDGTSVGFPPSAVGEMVPGDIVRSPPRVFDDELTQGVTDREVLAALRASRSPGDFLWITRLPDGRALFLLPWAGVGAQLSIGALGENMFTNTWNYHPGHAEAGWRAVLGWDGFGEPEGWTRHPGSGRVRPDGTAASEQNERIER